MKSLRIYLVALVTAGFIFSVAMGGSVMAAEPPGANADNVQMEVAALPTSQRVGEDVVYTMDVTNEQMISPASTAWARNITVTLYLAQADGNPSPAGEIVGTTDLLVVDGSVNFGATYPMPALNPGVTEAISRVTLNGTSMRDPIQLIYIEKEVSVTLLEPPVGGTASPVNKLGLVAPWAGVAAAVAALALLVLRRRRQA